MTDDLVEFLRARLDEDDEVIARHAGGGVDVGRAVRGVTAKRRILDAYVKSEDEMPNWGGGEREDYPGGERDALRRAVVFLASEWSTHEAYRTEWSAS